MSKFVFVVAIIAGAAGCGETIPNPCEVSCTNDTDCPSGQTCGEVGLCTNGTACPCTPGEFFGCVNSDQGASYCASNGTSIEVTQCGTAGCNADMKQCNACTTNDSVCSSDGMSIETCGSDGTFAVTQSCAAGCIAASGAAPRCGNIEPAWLPTVCDMPATAATATLGATLDVQNDASCTGGVVVANGTTFCVVRATTITIADLKVTGTRAVAFVADDALTVTGVLDVSADGATPGPGAGSLGNGVTSLSSSYKGGGGAGFAVVGGTGGGNEQGTDTGGAGGPATQRLTTAQFLGGARGGASLCGNGQILCFNAIDFAGGGGGGGAMLVACRGTVAVTGTIDANGGGGTGGGDHFTDPNNIGQGGAPGGGSGGFVVFQGVNVSLTGKLYANGGGGGGACGTDNCRGPAGQDGQRSTAGALGGDTAGNTCGGGVGGSVSTTPGPGEKTFASASAGAGGGGGSVGRFEVYTPANTAPALTPTQASPAPVAASASLLVK
jgi:hypothetical protein